MVYVKITVNGESYIGDKFRTSMDFMKNFSGLLLTKMKTTLRIYNILALKMALPIKLARKTFVVCRKSMKTMKLFSYIISSFTVCATLLNKLISKFFKVNSSPNG